MSSAKTQPPSPPGSERRIFERLDFFAQVELRDRDQVVSLRAHNISAGGLAVEIGRDEAPELVLGTAVDVHIDVGQVYEGEPLVLHAEAKVVHRREPSADRGGGVGLSWDANNKEIRDAVRRITRALKLH